MMNNSKINCHVFLWAIFFIISAFLPQASIAKGNVEKAGDALIVLIPAIGLGSTFLYEEGNEGTVQFFKSLVTSQVITFGLKKSINKERPNGECCDSFPSGHASVAFMGASFIEKRYGWKYGIPAYLAASFVGYSRIQSDKHFTEDVIAGAAIGMISSYIFTKSYNGFQITPLASNGYFGIYINKIW